MGRRRIASQPPHLQILVSAPWYVVTAGQKPYSRLMVAFLIDQSLAKMKLEYQTVNKERHAELLNIRKRLEQE